MAGQADLAALTVDRRLETNEIAPINAWYGHDQILKAYCGWDRARPLRIGIPHGVEYLQLPLWRRREAVPVVGYHTEAAAQLCRTRGARVLWPLASPFLYLLALQPSGARARKGTLFFPVHSFSDPAGEEFLEGRHDGPAIAEQLSNLPAAYQPVKICMYWLDVALGAHLPYVERGLQVVSAGHRFDPQFLVRLRHLMSASEVAMSNAIGSHTFYAIAAGCRYEHLDAPHEIIGLDEEVNSLYERDTAILENRLRSSQAEQRELAKEMLGAPYMLQPASLARQLRSAERLDRYGVARPTVAGRRQLLVRPPWALLRTAHRIRVQLRARLADEPRSQSGTAR